MNDWPPRFTMTAEGAVRLIMLNYLTEQNQQKTELALIRLVNEAYEQGQRSAVPQDCDAAQHEIDTPKIVDTAQYRCILKTMPERFRRETKMYAVRVVNQAGLEAADYSTVYGECPESFQDRAEAEQWAQKLSTSGEWPQGNPGYEVIER